MKASYSLLIGAGLLSGILNALLILVPTAIFQSLSIFGDINNMIGIFYGLITGAYFLYVLPVSNKILRLVAWTIVSVASYRIGVFVTTASSFSFGLGHLTLALGGLAGALVLAIGFKYIFYQIGTSRFILAITAGAAVAFLVASFFPDLNNAAMEDTGGTQTYMDTFFATIFIAWQTVITTILGSSFLTGKTGNISQSVIWANHVLKHTPCYFFEKEHTSLHVKF